MKTTLKLGVAALAAAGCLMTTTFAAAQEAGAEAGGEVGMALPGAAPTQAGAAAGDSDHDTMIGRIAVGYMGAFQVPISGGVTVDPGTGTGSISRVDISAPAVGIRYWIDQGLGIDAGLGFSSTGGSTRFEQGSVSQEVEDAGITAVLLHAGVPLSLTSAGHFSFQIVPELNIGYATQTQEDQAVIPGAPLSEVTNTGLLVEIGARVGAEIHFGFIDIPQLSLQAGVGVHFVTETIESKVDTPGFPEATGTRNDYRFETTLNNNPWDIFTSNIAALYYF